MDKTPTTPGVHLPSEQLTLVGGILVVGGMLALIIASWDSFSPIGRMITAVVPLLALYGLVALARSKAHTRPLAMYPLLTASIILPFVLGVIAYQSNLYPRIDDPLLISLALISAVNAGIIEFVGREQSHRLLTIGSLLVAAGWLGSWLSTSEMATLLIFMILGSLMMIVGTMGLRTPKSDGFPAWHISGAATIFFSLLWLPSTLMSMWATYYPVIKPFDSYRPVGASDYQAQDLLLAAGFILGGIILGKLAIFYSLLWQKYPTYSYLFRLRFWLERFSAAFLVLPVTAFSFSGASSSLFFLSLVVSIGSIFLSTKIPVKWFRTFGMIGLAVALIRLIFVGLDSLAAIWPILLLGVGILFIVIAVVGSQRKEHWLDRIFRLPSTGWYGLGKLPPGEQRVSWSTHLVLWLGMFALFVASAMSASRFWD